MNFSELDFRTKTIQTIIEPVSANILNLIEICATAKSPQEFPDMTNNVNIVDKSVQTLILSANNTMSKTNDVILVERLQNIIPILEKTSKDLLNGSYGVKSDASFQESSKLVSYSCGRMLQLIYDLLIALDDNTIRTILKSSSVIKTELNKGIRILTPSDLLENLKVFSPALPSYMNALSKRKDEIVEKEASKLIDSSLLILKLYLKCHATGLKQFVLCQDKSFQKALSSICGSVSLGLYYLVYKLETFIDYSEENGREMAIYNSLVLEGFEKNIFYHSDDDLKKYTILRKVFKSYQKFRKEFEIYGISRDLSVYNLSKIMNDINSNNKETHRKHLKDICDTIEKFKILEDLPPKPQKKIGNLIKSVYSGKDEKKELAYCLKHLKHCFSSLLPRISNLLVIFKQNINDIQNKKVISKWLIEKIVKCSYQILQLGVIMGYYNQAVLVNIEIFTIMINQMIINFCAFFKYTDKHKIAYKLDDIKISVEVLFSIVDEYEKLFIGFTRETINIADSINYILNTISILNKNFEKNDSEVNLKYAENIASQLMLLHDITEDSRLKAKLKSHYDNLVLCMENYRKDPNNKQYAENLKNQLSKIEVLIVDIKNKKEGGIDYSDSGDEEVSEKKAPIAKIIEVDIVIPEEYKHVESIILSAKSDDRIGMAAKNLFEHLHKGEHKLFEIPSEIALLFAELSKYTSENSPLVIETSKKIALKSQAFIKVANDYLKTIKDGYLKQRLQEILWKIPTLTAQLKMVTGVKSSLKNSNDINVIKETNETLFICSENLAREYTEIATIVSTIEKLNKKK